MTVIGLLKLPDSTKNIRVFWNHQAADGREDCWLSGTLQKSTSSVTTSSEGAVIYQETGGLHSEFL